MGRFSNNADVWISEDGETWIKVTTAYGTYAYNKTKYDELMNEPIEPLKITISETNHAPPLDYGSYVTPPIKYPGWIVGSAC